MGFWLAGKEAPDGPRVALFAPLPPAKTGTADYAEALVARMAPLGDLDVFRTVPPRFNPSAYDVLVYHIANNPYHADFYQLALRHPGVIVLHDPNLHYLIQSLTLHRGETEAYLRETLYEVFGSEAAPAADAPVDTPPSRRFSMLRRILDRSRGAIVHSRFAEREVLRRGFEGPLAVIPHGADARDLDPAQCRRRLGLGAGPVIGVFGYQRPDKRILECLRLFHRLLGAHPEAELVVAGAPHPEVPLAESVSDLGLDGKVRLLGFMPDVQAFDECLAACDIILNLRRPTLGETSGTLMRSLGLGRVAFVTDEGACDDIPDGVCVKIPADDLEFDVARECLLWLCSDAQARRDIGLRAQEWVRGHCSWEAVAARHWDFVRQCAAPGKRPEARAEAIDRLRGENATGAYLERWVRPETPAGRYFREHEARLIHTLALTPAAGPRDRVLEMGCYLQITPALRDLLGYGEVRGCYAGSGPSDYREIVSRDRERFACYIDLFNAEADRFPYPDERFTTVLCCELIEHLERDPMHMLEEIHRVLKPGGFLVLTTPNVTSLRATAAMLRGSHPAHYNVYPDPRAERSAGDRHHREYTPGEVQRLLQDAGFVVERVETGPYSHGGPLHNDWVEALLAHHKLPAGLRGDCIFAVGKKDSLPRNRLPSWLYEQQAGG